MSLKDSFFIVGTGTDIGKTYISRLFFKALKNSATTYYKPIQSGSIAGKAPDVLIKDMDRFDYKKYSLITSSSVFQWSKDFEQLLNKISSATDRLLFSIYIDGNLPEIENHFEVGLKYYEHKNILRQLKKSLSL
ncbi:MAG: dethiobiotin synthase [Cetobacterium sp.]